MPGSPCPEPTDERGKVVVRLPSFRLSRRLAALLPDGLNKVLFGNSGSDAADIPHRAIAHRFSAGNRIRLAVSTCYFPFAQDRCRTRNPAPQAVGTDHAFSCHFPIAGSTATSQ